MTWRDDLRPASFRGVPFAVEAASGEFGRRVQMHEYPQRDLPFAEDLGRRARELRISAFVVGDDVFRRRDRLIQACEAEGAGTLEHPTLGTLTVTCTGCTVSESRETGGSARLELSFVEAGTLTFPAQAADGPTATATQAAGARTAVGDAFAQLYAVLDRADFVADAAAGLLRRAANEVGRVARIVTGEALIEALAQVETDAALLVTSAEGVRGMVASLIDGLAGDPGDEEEGTMGLSRLAGFGADLPMVPATTPTRRQQAVNQRAFADLLRREAAIAAARLSSARNFDSYQAAVAARDSLADWIEDEMLVAGDQGEDDAFAALARLRAVVVADLSERSRRLARVRHLVLPASLPALALAYDLYEDAARDREIALRNRLAHEGLVPPGIALEVLTR
ncbi:MAG: DNA circularization N-terminal domain-containing protein [Rhodospirillales bacterium]|nr:DNA circularization N-terminal domain-containing protein [Rhodospirillales bacterium]